MTITGNLEAIELLFVFVSLMATLAFLVIIVKLSQRGDDQQNSGTE